ncbi:hypothetical protein GZL_00440 [Streptomyces sp. 769]|nr:hypothetical protein GZL_00440 [Streptomyces sp. 769]
MKHHVDTGAGRTARERGVEQIVPGAWTVRRPTPRPSDHGSAVT